MPKRDNLDRLEELIRVGQIEKVRAILKEASSTKLAGSQRLGYANICRRVGLVSLGLRFLTPLRLQDRERWIETAPLAHVAEYAVLLQRIGSVHQGLKILSRLDPQRLPEIHLYQAFCHFNLWEYEKAIPILRSYLRAAIPDYKKLVGQVNLAASLVVVEHYEEADALLGEILAKTKEGKLLRLEANCHELLSQIAVQKKEFSKARQSIAAAQKSLQSAQTLDQLFIKKWSAVIESFETTSTEPLQLFKAEAQLRRDWESVRDADFNMLRIKFKVDQFDHLVFGTPFSAYRDRAYSCVGQRPRRESYLLGDLQAPFLDLRTGEIEGCAVSQMRGKLHQVILVLLRDFYKPQSIGAIFSELFPNEYFNTYSSPNRVHQLLLRLRNWLRVNHLPLELNECDHAYKITFTGQFAFRCRLEEIPKDWNEIQMNRLNEAFKNENVLTSQELRNALDLSPSTGKRFTHWAVKNHRLERVGLGPATGYKLLKPTSNKRDG